jgi:multiple sugar transport system permease protein
MHKRLFATAAAAAAAYYSARHRFRDRTLFLLLVLATQMFQPAAMLVGIQREFTTFNLLPTLSLILVNAGFDLAFAVWILNAYLASIPGESGNHQPLTVAINNYSASSRSNGATCSLAP